MTLALERRRSHVTAASHIKTIYEDNNIQKERAIGSSNLGNARLSGIPEMRLWALPVVTVNEDIYTGDRSIRSATINWGIAKSADSMTICDF